MIDQVRVECDAGPGYLTIAECRRPWRTDLGPERTRFPIARLRHTSTTRRWAVYWRDRNLRFHRHDQLPASPHAGDLLQETGRDPIAIFWGQRSPPSAHRLSGSPHPPVRDSGNRRSLE